MALSQLNDDADDGDNGGGTGDRDNWRLSLPGTGVEFRWNSIKSVFSKMLVSFKHAAAAAAAAAALALLAITQVSRLRSR